LSSQDSLIKRPLQCAQRTFEPFNPAPRWITLTVQAQQKMGWLFNFFWQQFRGHQQVGSEDAQGNQEFAV
jgi:hypothetical protein